MSYINIILVDASPSGKTNIWTVQDSTGGWLATIRWFSPWRKYTVTFNPARRFDPGCMREIADFTDAETTRHKA